MGHMGNTGPSEGWTWWGIQQLGSGREDAGPYLLALLHTKLPADLNTLDCVDKEIPQSVLKLVLVEGTGEVPTQKDNGTGQELRAGSQAQGWVQSSQYNCSVLTPQSTQ